MQNKIWFFYLSVFHTVTIVASFQADSPKKYSDAHPVHNATFYVVHSNSGPCILHTASGQYELTNCNHAGAIKATLDLCLKTQPEPYQPVRVITYHDHQKKTIAGPYQLTPYNASDLMRLSKRSAETK